MKKIFIVLFLILTLSCVGLHPRYVFQRTYANEDSILVLQDIYKQLNKYDVDSIPLDLWITSYTSMDTNIYIQKMIRYEPEKQKKYAFIYTKFMYPRKIYYEFKVRYLGKEK